MVKIDRIEHTIDLPDGVSANISEDGVVTVKGPKGELSREYQSSRVVQLPGWRRSSWCEWIFHDARTSPCRHLERPHQQHGEGRDRRASHTPCAFYSHFPMTLKVERSEFVVNNYFGERVPVRHILSGVDVRFQQDRRS